MSQFTILKNFQKLAKFGIKIKKIQNNLLWSREMKNYKIYSIEVLSIQKVGFFLLFNRSFEFWEIFWRGQPFMRGGGYGLLKTRLTSATSLQLFSTSSFHLIFNRFGFVYCSEETVNLRLEENVSEDLFFIFFRWMSFVEKVYFCI